MNLLMLKIAVTAIAILGPLSLVCKYIEDNTSNYKNSILFKKIGDVIVRVVIVVLLGFLAILIFKLWSM
jgi:hypothetical protein